MPKKYVLVDGKMTPMEGVEIEKPEMLEDYEADFIGEAAERDYLKSVLVDLEVGSYEELSKINTFSLRKMLEDTIKEEDTQNQNNNKGEIEMENNQLNVLVQGITQMQEAVIKTNENVATVNENTSKLFKQINDMETKYQARIQELETKINSLVSAAVTKPAAKPVVKKETAASNETSGADKNNKPKEEKNMNKLTDMDAKVVARAISEFFADNNITEVNDEAIKKANEHIAKNPQVLKAAEAKVNGEVNLVNHKGFPAVMEYVKKQDRMDAIVVISIADFYGTDTKISTPDTKDFIAKLKTKFNNDYEKMAEFFRNQAREKYNVAFIKNELGFYAKEGINLVGDSLYGLGDLIEVVTHKGADLLSAGIKFTGTTTKKGLHVAGDGMYKLGGTNAKERENKVTGVVNSIVNNK